MHFLSPTLHFLKPGPVAVAVLTAGGAWSLISPTPAVAQSAASALPPAIARNGISLGLELPTAPVSATVWLNLHDKPGFDAAVKQRYTPGSPLFHAWMTPAELKPFEPTAAEVAAVKAELAAHHLTVLSADSSNLSVRFEGQTSDFESAFHTQLGRYRVGTEVVRATSTLPQLSGGATGLVRAVDGYSGAGMRYAHVKPIDPGTGKPLGVRPLTAGVNPAGLLFSSQCLYPPYTATLTTPAGIATAIYTGLGYGASRTKTAPGTLDSCSYSAKDLWTIYGLSKVYEAGVTGKGQTVVIVDAYGSPTITRDAATYNQAEGLPAFTSTSFQVYSPIPVTTVNSGWAEETTLDVEAAHAVAPGASIALVTAATNSFANFEDSILYAIGNKLGNVISNSWYAPESEAATGTLMIFDEINELAAAQGISIQYCTGDDGDFFAAIGHKDVPLPADSPYATGVGGTSVALFPDGSIAQTGWGNNLTELSTDRGQVDNPPFAEGFQGGPGGGESNFFAKPAYQSSLSGTGRQIPDVSALADPYTGFEILITFSTGQQFEDIGGTSLATPVFSAMWALLNQAAGSALGQAAPYIAAGSPLLVDVLPGYSGLNTTGSITSDGVTTKYSSLDLSAPLGITNQYTAALYQSITGAYYNLTFGTDSSLDVTPGYDHVTGFGTPSFREFPLPASAGK